jgi:hypothetical protein
LYFGADTKVKVGTSSVTINNVAVSLPFSYNNLVITSLGDYIIVDIRSALKIQWDGSNGVYVTIEPSYMNKTCGLCGNFNHIKADDFMTQQVIPITKVHLNQAMPHQ